MSTTKNYEPFTKRTEWNDWATWARSQPNYTTTVAAPAPVAWQQRKPKLPGVAWRPVYGALAVMFYRDGLAFTCGRHPVTKRVGCAVTVDGVVHERYTSKAGEVHAWLCEILPGYEDARAVWEASAAEVPAEVAPDATVTKPRRTARRARPVAEVVDQVPAEVPADDLAPVVELRPAASEGPGSPEVPAEVATVSTLPPPPAAPDAPALVLPEWATEWLDRLVYAPKRAYAAEYLLHLVADGPAPAAPDAEWVPKVHARAEWLARKASA